MPTPDAQSYSQCMDGNHYLYDDSAKQYVNVGPCDEPKHQVLNAAQNAQQAAQGAPQQGLGMNTAEPAGNNPNNPMAKAISDYFNGKAQ